MCNFYDYGQILLRIQRICIEYHKLDSKLWNYFFLHYEFGKFYIMYVFYVFIVINWYKFNE